MNKEELIKYIDNIELEIISLKKENKSKVIKLASEAINSVMEFDLKEIYPEYKVKYFEQNKIKAYSDLKIALNKISKEKENYFIEDGFWFVRAYLRMSIVSLR